MTEEIRMMLSENSDSEQSKKMAAYMKNKFIFAGIPKPRLKELIKPYIKNTAKDKLNWDLIFELWNIEFREAQYIAIEYLSKHKKELVPEDIENLKQLIVTKSWWDTVDSLDSFIGEIVLKDEKLKEEMLTWSQSDNIWLRRTAIDFQQAYKDKTDAELLEKIIVNNFGTDEFFINKAIGWSLREYGKTNPDWVKDFIEKYKDNMAKLSIKEATKLFDN